LKEFLFKYASSTPASSLGESDDLQHVMTASLGQLFRNLDTSSQSVAPYIFCHAFRRAFPQFAERSQSTGHYMQQDADECLQQVMSTLASKLPEVTVQQPAATPDNPSATISTKVNVIDYLFAGDMEVTTTCTEAEEPPTITTESFRKLRCHIGTDTNYLSEGILKDLDEPIERKSLALERRAKYNKSSRISKLPRFLIVQFVRFFWRNDTQKKAKILRKVVYPTDLDILPFCTTSLKNALNRSRSIIQDMNDEALGIKSIRPKDKEKKEEEKSKADKTEKKRIGRGNASGKQN